MQSGVATASPGKWQTFMTNNSNDDGRAAAAHGPRSAGFPTCWSADFQIGGRGWVRGGCGKPRLCGWPDRPRVWKPAIQQTWKSAVRGGCARVRPKATGFLFSNKSRLSGLLLSRLRSGLMVGLGEARLDRSDPGQVEQFKPAVRLPQQKHSPARFHRDVFAVRNMNGPTVRKMDVEGFRLVDVFSEGVFGNQKFYRA